MPAPNRCITTRDVRRFVDEHIFSTPPPAPAGSRTAGRVGIELEWVTRVEGVVPFPAVSDLRATVRDLPGGSRITFEPGGQLELSGPALPDIAAAVRAMTDDVAAARRAFAAHGVDLVGIGLDPTGLRPRVVDADRYSRDGGVLRHTLARRAAR